MLIKKSAFLENLKEDHPAFEQIKKILSRRSVEEQAVIDEKLTRFHAHREMTFQTKNEKTGMYDRYVAVNVSGSIAPMKSEHFNRLVQSTAPVLNVFNRLLQRIYSSHAISIESLGLDYLPRREAETALRAIRESIYFEPKLVHPAMRDYPFLAMAGFDGVIVDPADPHAIFFEFNSGTPSGLSNNSMLLEALEAVDPELFSVISPYLANDNTFSLVRDVIEANARHWTGRNGLTVMLSPGVYNGAHPDVEMIAKKSHLPLVHLDDLYEDRMGFIRLNLGRMSDDPIVTGILNRRDLSFTIQSNEDNIPLVSPRYQDNAEFGNKLGLSLRPGAIYDFVYNEKGERTDVHRNEDGSPRLVEAFERLGLDPTREAPRGSLIRALHDRKVYISNVGGRDADHKSLFRIVTNYLLPYDPSIARPVKGLASHELNQFFEHPDRYVVKPTGESGGHKMVFPVLQNEESKKQTLEEVRTHPEKFEVQEIAQLVTIPRTERSENGEARKFPTVIDWRIFSMRRFDGQVFGGPNASLVRPAAENSLLSNTSSGGGYGIGVVLENSMQEHSPAPTAESPMQFLTLSEDRLAKNAMELAFDLIEGIDKKNPEHDQVIKARANELSFTLREFLRKLPNSKLKLIGDLRAVSEGRSSIDQLERELYLLLSEFSKSTFRPHGLADAFRSANIHEFPIIGEDPTEATLNRLPTPARARRLPILDVPKLLSESPTKRVEQVELAEWEFIDASYINPKIEFLKAMGGQMRLVKEKLTFKDDPQLIVWKHHPAYFWTRISDPSAASYLIPVLAIDFSDPKALSVLEHEFVHALEWRNYFDEFFQKTQNRAQASIDAENKAMEIPRRIESERAAQSAEMNAEREIKNHPYLRGKSGPLYFYEFDYINRICYPEFVGVREYLKKERARKMTNEPIDALEVRESLRLAQNMVEVAVSTRARAIIYWSESKEENAKSELEKWQKADLITLISKPFGFDSLRSNLLLESFQNLIEIVASRLNVPELFVKAIPSATETDSQ